MLLTVAIIGCNNDNCSEKIGIKLDYHLFTNVKIGNMTYCDMVSKSLDGDSIAICNLLSVRDLDGVACYQHGVVLIKIIDKLTEEVFIHDIEGMEIDKIRFALNSNLPSGFEFIGKGRFQNSNIMDSFPLLFQWGVKNHIIGPNEIKYMYGKKQA